MIERYVFLKLRARSDRQRIAEAAHRELPRMRGVRAVRVGLPADQDAEVWDLVMVVRFDGLGDVASYLADPVHVAFVEKTLAPAAEVKKAWNFDLGEEPEQA